MCHFSAKLAIPRGNPPPKQLPAEFHNCFEVFEIIDSHLPGYVYLKLRYLLAYCPEDEKYNCVEYDQEVYMSDVTESGGIFHGPARLTVFDNPSLLSVDCVPCLGCLSWPPQAADWPTRHRNHGWPDTVTVDRVVNNGCDVVFTARCTLVQSAVLRSHVVCLSVRPSVRL